MDMSLNGHISQSFVKLARVWYAGTDALLEGEAVCFDVANGTAADANAKRHNQVVRPSTTSNLAFAGVALRDYSAKATGQFVEIALPGSLGVQVALGANVTLGDKIAFTAGSGTAGGRFTRGGVVEGAGTVRIAQTVAAGVVTSSAAGGMELTHTDGVTLTHTSATVLPGDTLVVLSGSNAGSDREIVAGRYTVASVTSATVCVLATSPAKATLAATGKIHGYIIRGNPRAQADLLEGPDCGGVQYVCPANAGGATPFMAGGLTIVNGGVTLAAVATATLADGTVLGARKGFLGTGTLTTNGYVVTVTNGIQGFYHATSNTALATATVDAAAELALLQWEGAKWILVGYNGATLA